MVGVAQRDRAAHDARGSPPRSHNHRRNRILGCNAGPSAIDGGAGDSIDVRHTSDVESAVTAFARTPNGGLIVTADPAAIVHRELIIALAARYRFLPCTRIAISSQVAAWFPTVSTILISFAKQHRIWIAY